MNETAAEVIARLGLAPLPKEGGFFRSTWVSSIQLENGRAAGSAIYFLLTPDDFSAFHQLRTDEVWLFHEGDPIEHVQLIGPSRQMKRTLLGRDAAKGHALQIVVPGDVWQSARLVPAESPQRLQYGWALVSCVMAPAWDEREFALGERFALVREFPEATEWIHALTR